MLTDENKHVGTTRMKPCVLWLTGLSGAGKSTLASLVIVRLEDQGCPCELLDGDVVRRTISRDLGFSDSDRRENIRRLGQLAREVTDQGKVAVVAAISPLRDGRGEVRHSLPMNRFVEVFVDAPLAVCETRDPKGLYQRARQGLIKQFTGIDSVYEAPTAPDVHVHTSQSSPRECVDQILEFLLASGLIKQRNEA